MGLLDKHEMNGSDNQGIQGNNNSGNEFHKTVNNYFASELGKNITFNIEEDLKDVILAFQESFKSKESKNKSAKDDFFKIKIEEKNKLNNLSETYYLDIVREHFPYFYDIDDFLIDDRNEELKEVFYDIVEELKTKQNIYCKDFKNFESFIDYVRDQVLDKYNDFFKRKKKFILVFLHFMYCRCLIGRKVWLW